MALDEGVKDAVTNSNFKNVAEAPAFYSGIAMGNAVAHQKFIDSVREAALGNIVKNLSEVDPIQAASALKVQSGNDLAQQLGQLGNLIAQLQQSMKGAQSTPPETGKA